MDKSLFLSKAPGELVAADGDYAFCPHPLPPNWQFPAQLWPRLAEAKEQIALLEGLGRNLPNPAILLRPLGDREAIKSSSLEGTYASPKELLLFEMDPRESESESDAANDWREVYNYRKALELGIGTELPLSLRLIRELHSTLLTGVRGRDRAPGEFRRIQVAIGASRRFVPPPPQRLDEFLFPLEAYFHAPNENFDPLVNCFLVHYQFETIHPFIDGNGRIGRLLLAIMLSQYCGLTKPWLYLSEYFEQHRDEYITRLFQVSARADWNGWIEYCLAGTIQQARETIRKCEQLRAIQNEFMRRIVSIGGNVRLNQIVEGIFHSPFLRIPDLQQRLSVTYPTAKADVDRLVQAGILQALPGVRIKTYYAPAVFDIVYQDIQSETGSLADDIDSQK